MKKDDVEKGPDHYVVGFRAVILNALLKAAEQAMSQKAQQTNMDHKLAEMYVWDEMAKLTKKQSDSLWDQAERDHIYQANGLDPGVHTLADSKNFNLVATVSQPVRRFNQDELARLLKASKFKVPEPVTKRLYDEAKVPSKSTVSLAVTEKQ